MKEKKEGMIQDGEVFSTYAVTKVIKTSETTSLYTKGLDLGSHITVRSSEIEEDQYNRLYLEELDANEFRVIKVEQFLNLSFHLIMAQ